MPPPLPDPLVHPLLRPDDLVGIHPSLKRSAIYEAIARGEIPSIHIGRRVYVPTAALRRAWAIDAQDSEGAPTMAPVAAITTDEIEALAHDEGTRLRAV